jgi:DNA-binding NtrC family response regulator
MPHWPEFLKRLRGEPHGKDQQRALAILQVNHKLAVAADQRQVLTVLVDEAVRLFGAERGFLVVQGPGGAKVEVARNLDREAIANAERKLSSTVLQQALRGEPVWSEDAQDGELGAAQSVADLRLRSVLAVPLRVGAEVLGCLYLDHRFQTKAFGESDLPWLMAFADQGAIVLHLHALLAQNRAQALQLARDNQSLQASVAAQAAVLAAPEPLRRELRHPFPGLVGESPAIVRALSVLDRVAETELPVLLTGESGTGKELAARGLHGASARRRGEFVAVNCAAIAPELFESELFGHVKGAFTGADRERSGLLRQAAGGTLFLDEVTELPVEAQAKLLRALEQRSVRPVGGDREFALDVRVVAATNREPARAVAEGRLREDLYFRLAVVTVQLPPLRERGADLVLLAEHCLQQIAASTGRQAPRCSAELQAALRARSWPGNVRQLRNELQRLCALGDGGELRAEWLSPELGPSTGVAGADHSGQGHGGTLPPATFDLAALERWAIEQALVATKGNKAEAARLLGIGRRTLYGKLGS